MCNFNTVCSTNDGTCACQYGRPEIAKPVPILFPSANDNSLISALFRLVMQQNEMIKSITEQSHSALARLTELTQVARQSPNTCATSKEELMTSFQLQKALCGDTSHPYSLQLISELPAPAYKERGFSLLAQIVDVNGNKVLLPKSTVFKVMLFSDENPPKLVKNNTVGDNILRGTVDILSDSTLFFRKIVIKEVSSHFRNGCFFLVIAPKETGNVKPLILEKFIVKARKINNEPGIRKKNRIELNET